MKLQHVMKTNMRLACFTVMVAVCTFMNVTGLSGQGNINITAGIGFPEVINAGIRYQMGQAQVGVAAGFLPAQGESVTSFSFDFWYHFVGSSELSDRRPWFGRLGLMYLHDKQEGSFNDKLLFLETRGGREFNLSEKFGISIDAGLMYKLYTDVGDNDVAKFIYSFMWALPAGGISFFYRF
jgi:hypothetical protein